jgi:hypothetical protein
MLYGDLGSREAVFVQRDGVAVDISHLPTAQAVPIKVHTLKQGQELPPGAVVINPAQQDASADGTAGQRERVQRAEVGSRAVMTSKREASIRGKVRSASVQSGGAGGTAQVLKSKSKQQKLMFARTTASAAWPSERNPLRDFDADFLDTYNVKGFPATTGTANWPFTKNPLLGFDEGFRNKWKGWQVSCGFLLLLLLSNPLPPPPASIAASSHPAPVSPAAGSGAQRLRAVSLTLPVRRNQAPAQHGPLQDVDQRRRQEGDQRL